MGAGLPTLPALSARLAGRHIGVRLASLGAASVPRFDETAHLRALAADPPAWPARTGAVSLLALELTVPRIGIGSAMPARSLRLELLDYPGEWLLDLPLLTTDFDAWSESTLRRLERHAAAEGPFCSLLPGCLQGSRQAMRLPRPAIGCTAPRCTGCGTKKDWRCCNPAGS